MAAAATVAAPPPGTGVLDTPPPQMLTAAQTVMAVHPPRKALATLTAVGDIVFVGLHHGLVLGYPVMDGSEPVVEITAHEGCVRELRPATHEGKPALLSCSADGNAKMWAVPSGEWLATFAPPEGNRASANCMAMMDGGRLAVGYSDGVVRLFDLGSHKIVQTMKVHAGQVKALLRPVVRADADGNPAAPIDLPPHCLLTASDDGLGKLVLTQTKEVATVFGCQSAAHACAFVAPNAFFGCSDGRIRAFDVLTGAPTAVLKDHTDAVNQLLEADGELYSASDDTTIRQWDVPKWTTAFTFAGNAYCVSAIAVDGAGRLVSAAFGGAVTVWDRRGVINRFKEIETRAAEERAAKLKAQKEAEKAKAAAADKARKAAGKKK